MWNSTAASARIEATVRHLSQTIGPRPPGSRAEAAAAGYLEQGFREAGLKTWVELSELPSHTAVRSTLRVAGTDEEFVSEPSQFSTAATVEGELLYLGSTSRPWSDLSTVSGRIGLLARAGGSHTEVIDYLRRLGTAGLQGLIVISPYMDEILTKSVRYPEITCFPVAAVSYRTAGRLRRLEGARAHLSVEAGEAPLNSSPNVIGELPGAGPDWLVVSAHLDTAPAPRAPRTTPPVWRCCWNLPGSCPAKRCRHGCSWWEQAARSMA